MVSRIKSYFPENYKGVIIEVGAGFPEIGNPIFGLRKDGWHIISVEPNPALCQEFRSLGLPILEYAAYNEDLGETEFFISPNGLSYSSLNLPCEHSIGFGNLEGGYDEKSAANNNLSESFDYAYFPKEGEKKNTLVTTLTINTILKKHHPLLSTIDVIIVDVEGFEVEVMQGVDLKKYKPKVIVLENIRSYPKYRDYMESQGYELTERANIDDIYTIKK